ncbi:hypothetical protein IT415_00220 [bacterium]|nr:hypothetical protein [bacterium]
MSKTWYSILGRERALALAELAAVCDTPESLEQHGAVAVGAGNPPRWSQIGGSQRAGEILGVIDTLSTEDILKLIATILPSDGKVTIGLSMLGATETTYKHTWIQLKQTLRSDGRSVRIVTAKQSTALNAAQVRHNQLLSPGHLEIVLWERKRQWWVGRTNWVQDIDAYAHRDRDRPVRDARVGMLPPKLAQTLINLAQPEAGELVYDPFCGTGVVLMEAALMDHPIAGSDLSDRMIEATRSNLEWLATTHAPINTVRLSIEDAQTVRLPDQSLRIVTEGYLGQPFGPSATRQQIRTEQQTLDELYRTVLANFRTQHQIKSLVFALPYWHLQGRDYHLSILDSIEEIGYTFDQFAPTSACWLTYRRQDQQVGRMIVRLIKKEQ